MRAPSPIRLSRFELMCAAALFTIWAARYFVDESTEQLLVLAFWSLWGLCLCAYTVRELRAMKPRC